MCCALIGGSFWCGEHFGFQAGKASALDVDKAASWGSTVAGVAAYRLWQGGDLEHLEKCDKPGWLIQQGGCFPHQENGRVHGWRLR